MGELVRLALQMLSEVLRAVLCLAEHEIQRQVEQAQHAAGHERQRESSVEQCREHKS